MTELVLGAFGLLCPACGDQAIWVDRAAGPTFTGRVRCFRCQREWVVTLPRIQAEEVRLQSAEVGVQTDST